jgi:hypothetical protein
LKQKQIDLKSATTLAINILDDYTSEDPHEDLREMCEAFWAMRHPANYVRKMFAAKWPNETITEITARVSDQGHGGLGEWLVTVKCGNVESHTFDKTLEAAAVKAVNEYPPGPDLALILGVAA